MPLQINETIFHGTQTKKYILKPTDPPVPDDFFDEKSKERLLREGKITLVKKQVVVEEKAPEAVAEISELMDITQISVAKAKELLYEEEDLTNLNKYLDMENKQETPRVTITRFIKSRITELTGHKFYD